MNMIETEPKGHGVRISTPKKMSHTSLKSTKSGTLPQTRTRNGVKTKQPEEQKSIGFPVPNQRSGRKPQFMQFKLLGEWFGAWTRTAL